MQAEKPKENHEATHDVRDVRRTACCVVGSGPGGAIVSLLLARAGVEVTLLEAHPDFDREFRGDTLHPSVMEIMDQLGLAERLLKLRHTEARSFTIQTVSGPFTPVDLSRLHTKYPYITVMPQTSFLEFITGEAKRYPNFRLVMSARVRELVEEESVVRGVRYESEDGWHEVRAILTVGADGRGSRVRRLARGGCQNRNRLLARFRGRAALPLPLPHPRARGLRDDGQRQGGRALNGGPGGALGDPAQERLSREPHGHRGDEGDDPNRRDRSSTGRRALGYLVHGDDDPQVHGQREDAVEDSDHGEPGKAGLDGSAEEEELADEAGQGRDADERDQEDHHRRPRRRPRPPKPREVSQPPPGQRDHGERPQIHCGVGYAEDDERRQREVASLNGDDAEQEVARLRNGGVGEQSDYVILHERRKVAV